MNPSFKSVTVMDGSGDFEIKWDGSKPEEVAEARAALEALRERGYQFFLVDQTPVDDVPPGVERLCCRRATVEEVVAETVVPPARKRGRPAKTEATAPASGKPHAVAHRPMRGG